MVRPGAKVTIDSQYKLYNMRTWLVQKWMTLTFV